MTDALTPVEQKTMQFYDDELLAARLPDGSIYVPVRRLCDNLGLDWNSQLQRMKRDDVLSEAIKGVVIITTPLSEDSRGGVPQEMICLPLEMIPGWLFGIQPSRVREDLRGKITRYRRECFNILLLFYLMDLILSNYYCFPIRLLADRCASPPQIENAIRYDSCASSSISSTGKI